MTWLFSSTARLPLVPAASKQAPMLAAMPMQVVATSQRRKRIVSMMPSPALGRLGVGLEADDLVADAVRDGLLGVEEAVALRILLNLLRALAAALGHHVDERLLSLENLLGLDLDVRRLPVHAAERLVDHDL